MQQASGEEVTAQMGAVPEEAMGAMRLCHCLLLPWNHLKTEPSLLCRPSRTRCGMAFEFQLKPQQKPLFLQMCAWGVFLRQRRLEHLQRCSTSRPFRLLKCHHQLRQSS